MPANYDKEAVYDNEISPLMGQIIEICQRERIPFMATFAIKGDDDAGPMLCTTVIAGKNDVDPDTPGIEAIKRAADAVFQKPLFMAIWVQSGGE